MKIQPATWLKVVLLGIALVAVLVGIQPIHVPDDIFWHVRLGGDFVKMGFSAYRDHYSFTYPEQKFFITSLPFDVLSHWFYAGFGYTGLQLLRIFFWLLTIGCLYFVFTKFRYPLPLQIFGSLIISLAMIARYLVRPELAGFPFLVLMAFVYANSQTPSVGPPTGPSAGPSDDPSIDRSTAWSKLKTVAILSALFAIWNIIHTGALVGYPIIGAFLVNWFVELIKNRCKRPEVGIFILASGIALFSGIYFLIDDFSLLHLQHVILTFFKFESGWSPLIGEYAQVQTDALGVAMTVYGSLAVLALIHVIYQRDLGSTLILLLYGWQATASLRMIPYAIVATVPVILNSLQELLAFLPKQSLRPSIRHLTVFIVNIGLSLLAATNLVLFLFAFPPEFGLLRSQFPTQIVADFQQEHWHGKMLADYELSSFLILPLGDNLKFFIDGRTNILYPLAHMKHYFQVILNFEKLHLIAKHYGIDYVLTKMLNPLFSSAVDSNDFSIVEFDQDFVLFSHADRKFENLTTIALHPDHLLQTPNARLIAELDLAEQAFSPEIKKVFMIDLIRNYLKARNDAKTEPNGFSGANFIKANSQLIKLSEPNLRFGAFIAEQEKVATLPLFLYKMITTPTISDLAKMAELALDSGQKDLAKYYAERIPAASAAIYARKKQAILAGLR